MNRKYSSATIKSRHSENKIKIRRAYTHTHDVTVHLNDSQMHIFLSVPHQSVSYDLVWYNGSENCSSTTRLLCSPSNLAFSLLLLFFFSFPSFLFLLWLWSMAAPPRQRSFTRFGGAFHEHQVRLLRKGKTNVDLQSVMEKWKRLQGWVSCWSKWLSSRYEKHPRILELHQKLSYR